MELWMERVLKEDDVGIRIFRRPHLEQGGSKNAKHFVVVLVYGPLNPYVFSQLFPTQITTLDAFKVILKSSWQTSMFVSIKSIMDIMVTYKTDQQHPNVQVRLLYTCQCRP
jgi:hypothetical protein